MMDFIRQPYVRFAFMFIPSVHVWDSDADRISLLQPMVRLYSVPFNAFTGEDEDEAEAIEEADEESGN